MGICMPYLALDVLCFVGFSVLHAFEVDLLKAGHPGTLALTNHLLLVDAHSRIASVS